MSQQNKWHNIYYDEIVKDFGSNTELGLHPDEIEVFRAKYGKNVLTPKKTDGPIKRLLLQFNQPLLYILIIAGVVTFFINELADSSVIFGVVIINAIVGFIQESKALKSLEALSQSMTTQAVVVRNGKKMHIDSTQVVPGDILFFVSGDKVAADVRLITSRDLQVNESALTGESMPVEKNVDVLPESTGLADRKNMVYASTLITYGSARGIVVETGDNTEVGKISQLISQADSLDTPLTIKISRFSIFLLWVIIIAAIIGFAIGVINGQPAKLMFLAAISIAVAAIPEGLPAAMTITLAIGVSRMVKRKAIIRKLPAVETLGSTTIICSDKTGTLTENQMTVMEIFAGNRMFNVFGSGYNTHGEIKYQDKIVNIDFSKAFRLCVKVGYLCNDSKLLIMTGRNTVQGDPTEGALIVSAVKANLDENLTPKQRPRIDTIPFESEYQYMATLHKTEKFPVIAVKGGVEKIANMCSNMFDEYDNIVAFDKQKIMIIAEEMASRGLRVLAFALKYVSQETNQIHHADVEHDLIFIGFQAMIDPPRPEVIEAVRKCHTAGIKIKMITGDHALTASSIAKAIGIIKDENANYKAITGKDIESYDDEQLKDIVRNFSVFARVTPEQKFRLVKALQAIGEICAMTGDGVNDAPALKQANIGIAMGITGTEVAKESADMVLTDDNFASIVAAIEEGRGVFDNIKKFILWTLPTNVAQGFVMMVAIFLNMKDLPILPAQILWINMSTAILLGLMLAFEPKETGIMERKPVDSKLPIIDKLLIYRNIMFGTFMAVAVLLLFQYELASGATLAQARGVTVSMFIVAQSFYLLNCRSSYDSIFKLGLFTNPFIWLGITLMFISQTIFLYISPVNKFFKVDSMDINSLLRLIILGLIIYSIVELEKFIRKNILIKGRINKC